MSHIKGGGRASLSDEAQDALTGLLLSLREPDVIIKTDHDRKKEHRKFVKKLVARHERRSLARKVNRDDVVALESTASQLKIAEGEADPEAGAASKKVRIELVEAIFSATKKASNKKGGKDRKGDDFKEGNKKTMVFGRLDTVHVVMNEAKTKLRMKKKPKRCFVVEKKVTVVLKGDLSGIKDGSKVYVTSQEEPTDNDKKEDSALAAPSSTEPVDDQETDPLHAVKQVYSRGKCLRRNKNQPTGTGGEHPRFRDCLDKLPELPPERGKLPAAWSRASFLAALDDERVLIICGATGSGKSTQIPPYILEGMVAAGQYEKAHILVTQPRRVAATSLARRVAQEMNSPPPGSRGSKVGYSVRLDRAVSDSTKIVYCTVGILLRMLVCPNETSDDFLENAAADSPLSNVTHVVMDEVHERDVNTDFVLTLMRRVMMVNKHIRLILMSATASADLFVRYFDEIGMKPPIIEIPGRTFPVDIHWISECEQVAASSVYGWSPKSDDTQKTLDNSPAISNKLLAPRATAKIDNIFICKLINAIIQKQQTVGDLKATDSQSSRKDGAILVFLPGKAEIEALSKTLYQDQSVGDRNFCKIIKLHSNVSKEEQQSVFVPACAGMMKIVLATNIAETSLTIPDVSHVIDTGRVKESRFNSSTRIKELVTVWTSQASAKQRAGRSGRTSAGSCWRLYSEEFCKISLPSQTCPEILRAPIDELVIQICLLYEHQRNEKKNGNNEQTSKGVCPIRFLGKTPEPPSDENVVQACKHLLEVGALTVESYSPKVLYRLTPLGYHLSRLPMDPKVGKVLLVGCMLGCLDNSLTVAASLSITKSCFPTRFASAKDEEWQTCLAARNELVETGFGGPNWKGAGTGKNVVKSDLIAVVAAFRKWQSMRSEKDRAIFCRKHGIDNTAMKDISSLRLQYLGSLKDAGFVKDHGEEFYNQSKDDALLTSCCLVAGLYPNVCTLMRPRRGGPKGGRLLTKEGEVCKTSSGSFQTQRLRNASESGKDAYAVFHSKHRSLSTSERAGEVFLSEVNFISRFALLLFGGELVIEKNALIVDGWLKFKVGESGSAIAALVLIQELRTELDSVLLSHTDPSSESQRRRDDCQKLLLFVCQLLAEE